MAKQRRLFASITVTDDPGRKKSLFAPVGAATLDEAKADYARLLTERADNRLRQPGMVPTFADYFHQAYLPALAASGKPPASVVKEKRQLERWAAEIGHVRLNKLGPSLLDAVPVKLSNDLAIRWGDIDWQRELVTLGARGESRNRSPRHLPMNTKLRTLLGELTNRRAPDSDLLFPGPRRREKAAGETPRYSSISPESACPTQIPA